MASHARWSTCPEFGRGDPSIARGTLVLVIDASVAHNACLVARGFDLFKRERLVAPPLLWSETCSALHESVWRGELSDEVAQVALSRLSDAPIAMRAPKRLAAEAWRIATGFGWAKTYDAEYLALAALLGCRLVTEDEALWRATARLGFVIGPTEL